MHWHPSCSLGCDVTALLHEGPNSEPEWVKQAELVLQDVWLIIAGMGVVPLIGAEPADKHGHVHLLGQEVTALLHKWADGKPHAVEEGELVLQVIRVGVARVRVLPFIRREPATQTPRALWEACKKNFGRPKYKWTDNKKSVNPLLFKDKICYEVFVRAVMKFLIP